MLFAGKVPMFGQHTQIPTTPKFVGRRKLAEQNRFLLKHRLAKEIIQKLIEEIHFFYRRQEFKIITRQNGSLILNMTGHSIVQSFSFSLRKITNNQQKMT